MWNVLEGFYLYFIIFLLLLIPEKLKWINELNLEAECQRKQELYISYMNMNLFI